MSNPPSHARPSEAERNESIRNSWSNDATAQQLIASGKLASVVAMLKDRRRVKKFRDELMPLDIWIVQSVRSAMREPDIAEKMTASQRKKLCESILKSTDQLEQSLATFQSERGMEWPFQPLFDSLSLDIACEYNDWLESAGITMDEESFIRARYACYAFLMHRLDLLFSTLRGAIEIFSESETVIKKPNDKNARRLYFIRNLNKAFCSEFRSPCRAAALELTSVFFECGDLDEATLSKLAPYHEPKGMAIPDEAVEQIRQFFADRGEPNFVDELIENTKAESNFGFGKKSSAE